MTISIIIFQSLTSTSAGGMGELGYKIAEKLYKKHDVKLYTINKGKYSTQFTSIEVLPFAIYILFFINMINRNKFISNALSYKIQEFLYDYFLSKHQIDSDILITTFPIIPRTLNNNRKNVKKIILIPQNPDEKFIYETCVLEINKYNFLSINDIYFDKWRISSQQKALAQIDKIVCISNIAYNSYGKFAKERKFVPFFLNNKFNTTLINTDNTKYSNNGKFTYLFVAHIVILKGLHHLLESWQNVEKFVNAELWIVGNIEQPYLNNLKAKFDMNNVVWMGYKANIMETMKQANLVIIPSIIDNEPQTAVEALLAHKPLIISDGCGNADWIQKEVPQAVFQVGNIEQLTEKLLYAYNNYAEYESGFQNLYNIARGNNEESLDKIIKAVIEE
jgi:glycosyltransferase involved in cell wall biosynthesis